MCKQPCKLMKPPTTFIILFTIVLLAIPVTQAASLGDFQFYPDNHIWNVPVDNLPVHPMSATYVSSSFPSSYLYLSTSFPINVVDQSTPKQYLTSIRYPTASDNIPYPIPAGALYETSGGDISDRHMLIVNPDTNTLYEFFHVHQASDGTWSAYAAQRYNLSDYALRPDGFVSANAAGVAMAPGLIRYDEVLAGEINHAILLSLYTSGHAHVWPAREDGVVNSASYPPLGQRFRLKASFDTSGYSPQARTILEAMKKYGVMLSMNSGLDNSWLIYGDDDPRWPADYKLYYELKTVHGSDFEAVDATSLMINENSGQARIIPIDTPTPTQRL